MSSTICPRFSQNAWKKDLCSNCYRSKEEHKTAQKKEQKASKLSKPANSDKQPPKGIIRTKDKKSRKGKITFAKELTQVIGFGGEWSDVDSDGSDFDDTDQLDVAQPTSASKSADISREIDELEQELDKVTKANTDFNQVSGNLMGDAETNIKRSFMTAQLGKPVKDGEGKKQTLKISVMPFGGPVSTNKVNDIKQKFNGSTVNTADDTKSLPIVLKTIIKPSSAVEYVQEIVGVVADKPTKETAEKSLLDEISETLSERQNQHKQQQDQQSNKIKLEIQSKRSLSRHSPIVKDLTKPRISVFSKGSDDSDSIASDHENGGSTSGYYDVVEASSRYENVPDMDASAAAAASVGLEIRNKHNESSFFSNHLISEMFAGNNVTNGSKAGRNYNFMSQITSDGLIVTKASSSDDAMDSTGSSFDYATSSDEELSSMNRSESDSGIGISAMTNANAAASNAKVAGGVSAKRSVAVAKLKTHTDYEDIQVPADGDQKSMQKSYMHTKSREMAGEPDGSADPDGSGEALPALPSSSPPPLNDEPVTRTSCQDGALSKNQTSNSNTANKPEKPAVPLKPTVSIIKAFVKRSSNQAELISELQSKIRGDRPATLVMNADVNITSDSSHMLTKSALKKNRAPEPPSPEDIPPSPHYENVHTESPNTTPTTPSQPATVTTMVDVDLNKSSDTTSPPVSPKVKTSDPMDQYSFLYTRNPTGSVSKSTSPVIREKDKRERATINPKFRSLNTFSSQYKQQQQQKQLLLQQPQPVRSTTPEPAPRKSLSLSQDCLAGAGTVEDKKKKAKFSIKKFLRINTGSSSNTSSLPTSADSNLDKKDSFFGKRSTYSTTNADDPSTSPNNTTPTVRPRLVIIHPIDINNQEVEVVKEMSKINEIVTGKPPAPPLRKGLDTTANNKPTRPPPPKSAEVRRKQLKLSDISSGTRSPHATASMAIRPTASVPSLNSVYANLGEIRSSIAPRKPERTASMREREAQLEIARKRLSKFEIEDDDQTPTPTATPTLSPTPTPTKTTTSEDADYAATLLLSPASSAQSTLDRCELKISSGTLDSQRSSRSSSTVVATASLLGDGIKNSIQKMNCTVDSYLKDRQSDAVDAVLSAAAQKAKHSAGPSKPLPPATPLRSISTGLGNSTLSIASDVHSHRGSIVGGCGTVELRSNYEPINLNHSGKQHQQQQHQQHQQQQQAQRSSLPDQQCYQQAVLGGSPAMARANGYCQSDIVGPSAGRYHSQTNIARGAAQSLVSPRSYCGSELSDFDIYAPYSFYGTAAVNEAGGGGADVAALSGCGDDVSMWSVTNSAGGSHHQMKSRPANRLRVRKGRSVVHTSLEDNYGAVVVANHEALAQVLDQLQKTTHIAPQLRPLANSINLRFDDFVILEGVRGVVAGRRAFHPAIWAHQTHVTLALSVDCNQMSDLSAITEFCDLVPSHYLPLMPNPERQLVQATISVLPRMFVDTLQSFGQMLRIRADNLKHHQMFSGSTINLSELQLHSNGNSNINMTSSSNTGGNGSSSQFSTLRAGQSVQNLSTFQDYPNAAHMAGLNDDPAMVQTSSAAAAAAGGLMQMPGMPTYDDLLCREVGFVLLQLVNGLKSLQAKGIEQLPLGLSNVILCRELEPSRDAQSKLFVLHGLNQDSSRGEEDEPLGTLCQCAHAALTQLLPATKLTPTLTRILVRDRSESLSKTKAVLEFALWGPVDVDLSMVGGGLRERELALQRWLDLERATVLHGLIRSRVELSVYDECHLMFLVRSSAKTMYEASAILSGLAEID